VGQLADKPFITKDHLEAIKARYQAATRGEWVARIEGRDEGVEKSVIVRKEGREKALYLEGGTVADYEFVAHAKQDIPMLVLEIERLRNLLREHRISPNPHAAVPIIQALGVYRVEATPELLQEALEVKYGGDFGSERDRKWAEAAAAKEIASIALIELLVINPDDEFTLEDMHQPGSDQVPYEEMYLSEDGKSAWQDFPAKTGPGKTMRLVFYLHYFKPGKPLLTCYGKVALPPMQEMPAHLAALTPYHLVD